MYLYFDSSLIEGNIAPEMTKIYLREKNPTNMKFLTSKIKKRFYKIQASTNINDSI